MIDKIRAWLALSRPPFHTVGVLPFLLGSVLAWNHTGVLQWDIFAWGTMGVVLVITRLVFDERDRLRTDRIRRVA